MWLLWSYSAAGACTVCDSSGGRQLRATIFNDSFAGYLLLVALPFLVLATAVSVVHLVTPEFVYGAGEMSKAHTSVEEVIL